MEKFTAVVLAAGAGTRMKSNMAKPAFLACGKSLAAWVVDAARGGGADKVVVVVGHEKEQVINSLDCDITYVEQKERLGTGHALLMASEHITGEYTVILCGDTPLVTDKTIKAAYDYMVERAFDAVVLTAKLDNPFGYGRIVKNDADEVLKIVEQKNCTEEEKKINEVNSGMYIFKNEYLLDALKKIEKNPVSGEYYLTDAVEIFVKNNLRVGAYAAADASEILGVNDRVMLYEAECVLRRRINYDHMYQGVTITDPEHTYIEPGVKIGIDTTILPGCIIKKGTVIGEKCLIGPNTELNNVTVEDGVDISNSVCIDSKIGAGTHVGPFAYIRPGTSVGEGCRIGDFVELKNSNIGDGTKVSHLTYVGDSDIGCRVNFGCGTVTVNYDGAGKYRTVVEDDVFLGCNTNLISPVVVHKGAYIAAGSTITEDVPGNSLAIARSRQVVKEHWSDRRNKK